MIRFDKFTQKAQEAVQQSQSLASDNGHQQILPLHLLIALAEQQEGVVKAVLSKLEIPAAAVAKAGALGSLPCAMLDTDAIRGQFAKIRAQTENPINLGFFCHAPPTLDNEREARWRERLAPYYHELAIDPAAPVPFSNRAAFDASFCEVVEELRPQVVSFHFGLPEPALVTKNVVSWALCARTGPVGARASSPIAAMSRPPFTTRIVSSVMDVRPPSFETDGSRDNPDRRIIPCSRRFEGGGGPGVGEPSGLLAQMLHQLPCRRRKVLEGTDAEGQVAGGP